MKTQPLLKAAQDMLDAVKAISTAPGIDWTNPAYAPVALAHANLTDALTEQSGKPLTPEKMAEILRRDGIAVIAANHERREALLNATPAE